MLEQDPDNLPSVQAWLDKWFCRGMRMLALVGTMMDYMLYKRVMSWKEAWEIYGVENGGALFRDLARYGIRTPKGLAMGRGVSVNGTYPYMIHRYQWRYGGSARRGA